MIKIVTRTSLWITAAAVVAVALAVAWSNFVSARDARAALADLATRGAQLNAEIKAAEERVVAARNDRNTLESLLHETRAQQEKSRAVAAVPAKEEKSEAADTPPTLAGDVLKLIEANPNLHDLYKRAVRGQIAIRLLPIYQKIRLSPVQRGRWEELIAQETEDKLVLAALMQEDGVVNKDPAVAEMRRQMEAKFDAAQLEILGEAAHAEVKRFKRLEPLVSFTNKVVDVVGHTSAPLTVSQTTQLLDVMAQTSSRYQAGGMAEVGPAEWPRVLAEAQRFLPPTQFAAVKAIGVQLFEMAPLRNQFYQQTGDAPGK
jgi:hypothetical protein